MKINGIGFNHAWAKSKTTEQFVKEFQGMDHIFPDAKDKVAALKDAHALLLKTPLEEDADAVPADVVIPKAIPASLATNNPGNAAVVAQK